jgi:hypothetical protein
MALLTPVSRTPSRLWQKPTLIRGKSAGLPAGLRTWGIESSVVRNDDDGSGKRHLVQQGKKNHAARRPHGLFGETLIRSVEDRYTPLENRLMVGAGLEQIGHPRIGKSIGDLCKLDAGEFPIL